jgi:predicted HNH restriction endonuclease
VKPCPIHGLERVETNSQGRRVCRLCDVARVSERRRTIKQKLITEHGEGCQICGYNKCDRSLSFHHLDPTTKEFTIAANSMVGGMERLRKEAAKCILLCANCHGEVEAGITQLAAVSPPSDTR